MNSSASYISPVSVLYYCPCTSAAKDHSHKADKARKASSSSEALEANEQPPLQPGSNLLALRVSTIENLYYCDDCSEIRCNRCVIEEPAGYHCPNCLFDVPTASVRSEKNCCARNCFQCPVCAHVLSVVENDLEKKPFSLACSVCYWDSREIGWEFEKATGISAQIERMKQDDHQTKEFANLLDYWRTVHHISANTASSMGLGVHTIGGSQFKHRFGASVMPKALTGAEIPVYKAATYVETDHSRVSSLMAIDNADYVSRLSANAATTAASNEPQRVRLSMKLARRCRSCHHILIKPESKAQATRFKIQLMAANFIPKITLPISLSPKLASDVVLPQKPLRAGTAVPVILRFSNPLYSEMQVCVSAHPQKDDAFVEIHAEEFTLPPFTELWEYDDDDDDNDDGNGSSDRSDGQALTKQRGIVDRHGNRVAIQLNIMPKIHSDNMVIPLRVVSTHQDDMGVDMDTDADTSALGSSHRVVTNKFWVYVSLGPVERNI
ncbi:hypothetical protein J3B02_001112 [Coemansia erecta]|uniref:Dynactin subunit 4 n=1 Tax=Coemansia asiatica TaxID=1052880 RepID=A0A9W8CLM8_9FUNG|nr:hypothetical protein LPJ64_000334 [Coemansia asiatica]KAJ2857279.1 hypothetical protein J3B02_001112 [Coemansia erecta]KAJ2888477.1 hypothetical protein FB639_000612 [Coemansia asiatica]